MKSFSALAIVEDAYLKELNYPFIKTLAGREYSKRQKQVNDCTVRTLALALNKDYDFIYDFLAKVGRGSGKGLSNEDWKELMTRNLFGYTFKWHFFPSVKGNSRMNPHKFCNSFPLGTYIANMAHHVAVFVDGVLYDETALRPDKCIYGVWEVIKN